MTLLLNMTKFELDLGESFADENLIVRRKQPLPDLPDVSLAAYLFDKLDKWADLELFVSFPLELLFNSNFYFR